MGEQVIFERYNVTVTVHYFDAEFNLKSCILNTGAIDEKKTAEVLGNFVKEV